MSEKNQNEFDNFVDNKELSVYYKNIGIPAMKELRAVVDELEVNVGAKYWPYPSYADMLFYV